MQRLIGIGLIAASAAAYSLAGYFTRLIPLDVMTLLFWRGLFAGLMISALVIIQHRGAAWRETRAIGWPGLLIAGLTVLSSYLYLGALRHTTVAAVSVIYATLPFLTAGLAWLLLRERGTLREVVAGLVALIGVAVMAHGEIGSGRLGGDLLAFGMTMVFGITIVLIRRGRTISMLPAVALSCLLTAAIAWPFAKTGPLTALPMLHLILFGTLQLGLGLALLTTGMRLVSSTQAALVGLLDVPLAPIWVWIAFGEVPPMLTLVGGAVVLGAVVYTMGARSPAVGQIAAAIRPTSASTASRSGIDADKPT
ncbi:DMT family transporter [Acidisoma cladoniae]|jgi:drug/metabolite transporter (DMT)-like permease|uniref:DMT family transporter n=1 Tax=Acidisoma cladoniae TaxID=3040935 RepID=UPI0025514FC3|nr:DMT family transporter [Acidisoma sp. PAMC 29798]